MFEYLEHSELRCQLEELRSIEIGAGYAINPVSPNPCHESAMIGYSLAEPGSTEILVFDISGHVVNRLIDDTMGAGSHNVVWDLKDGSNERIPSGLYFIRIQSGDWTGTTRLIVAR